MQHRQLFFGLSVVLLATSVSVCAKQIRVDSVSYDTSEAKYKLSLGVTESPKYRVFVMDAPSRLVIDIKNAQAAKGFNQPPSSHPLFGRLRIAAKNDSDLRIVVDLKQTVSAKTHKLATDNMDDHRLVVNLIDKQLPSSPKKPDKTPKKAGQIDVAEYTPSKSKNNKKRFIVAIDAGHGGDDPGAQGPHGTREKQVTLAIAKKLEELIDGQSNMRAKLIRKGDYYVGLRERMKLARDYKADLFISIHADAVDNPEVRGASVYTLSRNGASSEAARWLANSENAKEKVGGVNLDDKDETLAQVLLDLSQTATQQASAALAEKVLANFRSVGDLHNHGVQNAGFVVLKSPDIPSILVETAYISNPNDELNLMSNRYQTKMANAIFKGVINYVDQVRPQESNRMAKAE
jgi:N-acetylmuramoyl-L-alanine amidase